MAVVSLVGRNVNMIWPSSVVTGSDVETTNKGYPESISFSTEIFKIIEDVPVKPH